MDSQLRSTGRLSAVCSLSKTMASSFHTPPTYTAEVHMPPSFFSGLGLFFFIIRQCGIRQFHYNAHEGNDLSQNILPYVKI